MRKDATWTYYDVINDVINDVISRGSIVTIKTLMPA